MEVGHFLSSRLSCGGVHTHMQYLIKNGAHIFEIPDIYFYYDHCHCRNNN